MERGQMRPFTKSDVATIRAKLYGRNLALFEVAISSMLRASDIVTLTAGDVLDRDARVMLTCAIRQKKTGKPVMIAVSTAARAALQAHIDAKGLSGTAYIFQRDDRAAGNSAAPISTVMYRRLVKDWADLAGYADTSRFSGHSTRRTKASMLYAQTKDIAAVRVLLGHASLAHTAAYLNVGSEDALALAASMEV